MLLLKLSLPQSGAHFVWVPGSVEHHSREAIREDNDALYEEVQYSKMKMAKISKMNKEEEKEKQILQRTTSRNLKYNPHYQRTCLLIIYLIKDLYLEDNKITPLAAQSHLTLCDPLDCSLPCSSCQARTLEWVAISFFRGSSWPWDLTCVSCIAGGFFTTEPSRKHHKDLF